jgi:hypothetical protein
MKSDEAADPLYIRSFIPDRIMPDTHLSAQVLQYLVVQNINFFRQRFIAERGLAALKNRYGAGCFLHSTIFIPCTSV